MHATGYRPHRNPLINLYRRVFGTLNLMKRLQWDDIFGSLDLKPHETVLDFGCSSGYMTYEIARRSKMTYGIDITDDVETFHVPSNLAGKLKFLRSRGEKTPFEDAQFDVVLMSEVIPMIPDPKEFFKEVSRIIKKGGRIVTVNPVIRRGMKKAYDNNSGVVWLMKKLGLAPLTYDDYTFKLQESFGTAFRAIPPSEYYYKLFEDHGYVVTSERFTPSAAAQEMFEKIQFSAYCLGLPTVGSWYSLFYPVLKIADIFGKKSRGTVSVIVAEKK